MAYKRGGRKTWTFQARTQTGFKQLGTRTASKALAGKMEEMWERLATEHRAWDLLGRVLGGILSIGGLFDLWESSNRNVGEVRRLLRDVALDSVIVEWYAVHRRQVLDDSARHALRHVLELFGGGTYTLSEDAVSVDVEQSLLASAVTTDLLTHRLFALRDKQRNTLRKVHSSWSVFFAYCTSVKGLFHVNPMHSVARPPEEASPIRFFEMESVELIVGSQLNAVRRALFAVLYGTGLEISTALGLTTTDVLFESRQIRGAGTKYHTRDRMARMADWAWPLLEAYARSLPSGAPLFSGITRHCATKWHTQTLADLGLEHIPMMNARHHWAVRMLRAGAPIRVVQEQLGHASPTLTLKIYGRFRPTAGEMDEWEQSATARDERRRGAR